MIIEASQRIIMVNSQGGQLGGNEFSSKETLGIRNKNASKCSKRCRQVKKAFANKAKTKRGDYAH
jgi:hypothetical protein